MESRARDPCKPAGAVKPFLSAVHQKERDSTDDKNLSAEENSDWSSFDASAILLSLTSVAKALAVPARDPSEEDGVEEEETGRVRISSAAARHVAEDTRDLCRPDRGRNHRRPRGGEALPASSFSGTADCACADGAVAKGSGHPVRHAFRDRSGRPDAQARRNGPEPDLAAADRKAP